MKTVNLNGNIGGNLDAESTRSARRTENGRELELNSAGNAAGSTTAKGDALNFSERAAKVAQLVDRIAQMPDVRSERVERLSRLIGKEAYQPSARDIADAILRTEH